MKKLTKKQVEKLRRSLKDVCLTYSDFKSEKRRESFGLSMFNRLDSTMNYDTLYNMQIVYKGAQWGGKWGNFCKAIYFRDGSFHYGSGFSNKQIFS